MKLRVTDREGHDHEIDAIEGWRVMEIIRDHAMQTPALAIKAECGAALACGTCHVYVDADWVDRLVPPTAEETERMEEDVFALEDNSRLSCQILMTEELDGLHVTLAPGSEP
ncbi:MAG: 2Fe-2S iron-sulfur cluster binding domain-containing protein [Alphaproteobacteria bacterium]|nr:2Fe-2S iron-sulfur cluster binding domain-containing protein [Alphaproteobacteria bacterium]